MLLKYGWRTVFCTVPGRFLQQWWQFTVEEKVYESGQPKFYLNSQNHPSLPPSPAKSSAKTGAMLTMSVKNTLNGINYITVPNESHYKNLAVYASAEYFLICGL